MSDKDLVIQAPKFEEAIFRIVGVTPYVQHKFSQKAREMMMAKQAEGKRAQSKRTRDPKDFNEAFDGAIHYAEEGWCGIPAPAFRCAMIDACRLVGYKMTMAKCSILVIADGIDRDDASPLVRLDAPPPERLEGMVRLPTGVADIRVRPIWRKWAANVRIKWDSDQFSLDDIANLLMRAGLQVGIGEGRPFSKKSTGQGWGTFTVEDQG